MTGSDATLPDVHTNLAAAILHATAPKIYAARGKSVARGLADRQEETADVAA